MKKIKKTRFSQICESLSEHHDVYVPIEKGGSLNFSLWDKEQMVNTEALQTQKSPKNFCFPQSETYLHFKTEGKSLQIQEVIPTDKPYVLWGVRPCDAQAFNLMDEVFLREPVDRLYEQKRNRGLVISSACFDPKNSCFCHVFGIELESPVEGVDIFTWSVGDYFFWQAQTEKGQALTLGLDAFLEEASEGDLATLEGLRQEAREKLKGQPLAALNTESIRGDLQRIFESEVWEQMSKSCLGCGSCTYLCPTCHCYDIEDYDGQKEVERFRCWDSCMFSDFTLMAHGNPRTSQKERFRQRFMHKLVYYPENHKAYACVGCGRCVDKCPVNMNIAKVIKKIGEESR